LVLHLTGLSVTLLNTTLAKIAGAGWRSSRSSPPSYIADQLGAVPRCNRVYRPPLGRTAEEGCFVAAVSGL